MLLISNAPLGLAVNLTTKGIVRAVGPIAVWRLFQEKAQEAGRGVTESLEHLGAEAKRLAVETFRDFDGDGDGDGDGDALSASLSSGVSDDSRFLRSLTDGLDRVTLRTFFSSIPEKP